MQLVLRYLDVAQEQLLLDDMDGVPRIHNARVALVNARNAVTESLQAGIDISALSSHTT
jgi:hypothetical protein